MSCNTFQMPCLALGESVVLGFNFADECTEVTAILDVTVTVESSAAGDPTPANLLNGAAAVDLLNPAQVNQRIGGDGHTGVDLTEYNVQCRVTTDRGDTLIMVFIVPVRQASRPVA